MRYYWLLIGTLAVWRITHLLQAEDGPWDLMVRFRRKAGNGFWGNFLDCFNCLSLWISAPLAWFIGQGWTERIILWPAFSGGAILLERFTSRKESPLPAYYFEDSEVNDGLLRKTEKTNQSSNPEFPNS